MKPATLPRLLQLFFTDRLVRDRDASPHTIAGYRDSFRLLLRFAAERLHKAPSDLDVQLLDASFIGEFLDHLEKERGCTARTRNTRLAAIHAFFRYVALNEPAHALLCQRVLAIPSKRYVRRPIAYLTRPEVEALLTAPNLGTWTGRRDQTLLLLVTQTGLRVSELVGLRCKDVALGDGPAPARRRPVRHRALARTRVGGDHPDLPPCRHADEREGPGTNRSSGRRTGALHPEGRPSGVPGSPVTMPPSEARAPAISHT